MVADEPVSSTISSNSIAPKPVPVLVAVAVASQHLVARDRVIPRIVPTQRHAVVCGVTGLDFCAASRPNGVMTVRTTAMTATANHELCGSGALVKHVNQDYRCRVLVDGSPPTGVSGRDAGPLRPGRAQRSPSIATSSLVGGGLDGHEGRWRKRWDLNVMEDRPGFILAPCLPPRRDIRSATTVLIRARSTTVSIPRTIETDNSRDPQRRQRERNLATAPTGWSQVHRRLDHHTPSRGRGRWTECLTRHQELTTSG